MVKKTWLLCLLFLFGISALPVQSQTPLTNPTAAQLAPCGLPTTRSVFTDSADLTTFNMTADCTIGTSAVPTGGIYLHFQSGTFTINGNGHTINGPAHGNYAIIVGLNTQDTSTVLHLNDITIRGAVQRNVNAQAVLVQRGAQLHGRNVVFQDNHGVRGMTAFWGGKIYLENAQFLNNRLTYGVLGSASAATVYGGSGAGTADTVLSITNGIFEGNRDTILATKRVIKADGGTVRLQGCIIFRNNQGAIYEAVALSGVAGVVTDTTTNQGDRTRCPKKRKKETATPRPSATARPLATTCIDLHQATGIAVRATYGLASGVQCQRLDGGGIGLQSIVEAGFIDAVDIWGYVEQGVEVCFPQLGELLFLDASMMPRAAAPLASTAVNGMTCGAIETPGSIVLMPRP